MGCLQAEGAACGRELVFKGRHAAGEGSVGGMAVFVGRSESSTPIWQRPKGASPISASAVPVPGDSDRRSGGSGHLRERATCHRELAHASSFLVARLRGASSPLAVRGLSSEPLAAPLVGRGACPPPTSSCRALPRAGLARGTFDVGYDTAASGQRESGSLHG